LISSALAYPKAESVKATETAAMVLIETFMVLVPG
jgi:hypothetical protein